MVKTLVPPTLDLADYWYKFAEFLIKRLLTSAFFMGHTSLCETLIKITKNFKSIVFINGYQLVASRHEQWLQ